MILVTGGTGFVGRRLVNSLAAAGRPVRVLTRRPDRAGLPAAVDAVPGDLADPASLARALFGVDAVVHLAARLPASGADGASIERANVAGTEALARAAAAAGVRRFVHGSSAGVYGDGTTATPHRETDAPNPGNAYERSKLAGEAALKGALTASAVRWTILRPAGIYGPGRPATAALFREVARRRLWIHGPVPVVVHPTYVDDVACAVQMVLARDDLGGAILNVGGERPLDYAELIAMIARAMGRGPRQVRAPSWLGGAAGAASRVLGHRTPPRLRRLAAPVINRALDTTEARTRLGLVPVPLSRGVSDTAAWVLGQAAP